MKTCEDCGCRVYEYGCVNCNEQDYIDVQNYELGLPLCYDEDDEADMRLGQERDEVGRG